MSVLQDIVLSPSVSIGSNHPCVIVAEIGQNHQGDINIAEKLISTAKDCGANVVKFQMSCLTEKFTKSTLASEYTGPNSWGRTYGEHKKHLEFTKEDYSRLQHFAASKDILFTASAMDTVSLELLNSFNPPFIKIGSGDNTNFLLLDRAVALGRPLVISTGMMSIVEVESIYKQYSDKCEGAFLHCVSAYPTLPHDVNLNVLDAYKEDFPKFHVGYSGHEKGIAISLAAVTKGAKILERHITLDKKWKGTDHICSLAPHELQALVEGVREVEASLGSKLKVFLDSEVPCYQKLGKSIVAAESLLPGTKITMNNIKIKVSHPKGLDPIFLYGILGRSVSMVVEEDDPINESVLTS